MGEFIREEWQAARDSAGTDLKIKSEYFGRPGPKKLHIGCGTNHLLGWLNSDYCPQSDEIFHLDATDSFPFPDDYLDYVFSEHVIEHFTYDQGLKMLSECCRILRVGGRVRIATPNLSFLIELYQKDKSELQKEYIKWATDNFIPSATCYADTFVINNFVRDWDHQFIYDEKILKHALEKAGFIDLCLCSLGESEHEELRGLEHEDRIPDGFLKLETLILEGTKPEKKSGEGDILT